MLKSASQKKTANLTAPVEIWEAFDQCRQEAGLNEKQKWLAVAAAMLLFIEMDAGSRGFAIGEVNAATFTDSFDDLVARAKAGRFREVKR